MKLERNVFGYHLVLDLYGCDRGAIDSMEVCRDYLNGLVDLIGVHKQAEPIVFYTDPVKYPDKAGISAWVPIVESGFSIHTITPTCFASIDIYSCKEYSCDQVMEFTRKVFSPSETEEKRFLRGEKYIYPAAPCP